MEEFERIDWLPNIEDMVDDRFINEDRLQSEGAMYKIVNGTFCDPFQDIRPPTFKPKQEKLNQVEQNVINRRKKTKGKKSKKKKNK